MLIGIFLALIGVAWAISNPPGVGPDERAHYVKALGAGGGDLYGEPETPSKAAVRSFLELVGGENGQAAFEDLRRKSQAAGIVWQRRTARQFMLPAGLNFSAFGCGLWTHNHGWGTCLAEGTTSTKPTEVGTYVGTYQPYLYVLPGVVMRSTHEPFKALRLGRLTNAVISLGLILVAVLLLWDRSRGALALTGLAVAVTPAVVFFSTLINPTGPEITAAICFVASLLRLARAPGAPTWVWVACAASGAVLALTRSLGPFFLALLVLTVAALAGRRATVASVRAAPRAALLAAGAIGLAAAAGLFWERRYQPHVPSGPGAIIKGLGPSLDILPDMPKQAVGVFGALDVLMPLSVYVAWWVMLGVLVGAAAIVSGRRGRWSLLLLGLAVVAVTLVVSAVYRQTGFELQARYVLPFAVVFPLWAGELLSRHRSRMSARVSANLLLAFIGTAAVLQAIAWYANSKTVAVGNDAGWRFIPHADWVPPLGWWTWVVVVVAAASAYVLAGAAAARAARAS